MQALLDYFAKVHHISKEAEQAILAISSKLTLSKNKELQPIGHTCKTIYFIMKGMARIFYYKDGIDVTESFAFENNVIARIESLFTGQPSRKGIQILEDAELIAINANELFKLYDRFHEVETLFRKIFESAFVETVNRIESIQFHTAEERYHTLLQQAPGVIKRVPLKYIASYLGITQQSLSRIRAHK